LSLEFRSLGHPNAGGGRRVRIGVAIVLLAGLAAGSALLLKNLSRDRPNLYDPTRIALVEAQRNLSEAYGHATQERALFEQIRSAHRALDEALTLLEKAERLDPIDKATIDTLRARLNELEDDQKILQMSEAELRRNYQYLSNQMERIIERRE
jgi:hypothetical protein